MSEAAARTFFSSPAFAVVGASSNPAKFGNIIFKWYHAHSLPVTPINPTAAEITLPSHPTPFPALPSITRLPSPTETSLSIVTPPVATLAVLREAKGLGVPAVWLQPGTFDDEVLRFLREEGGFKAAVAGEGGRERGVVCACRWGEGIEGSGKAVRAASGSSWAAVTRPGVITQGRNMPAYDYMYPMLNSREKHSMAEVELTWAGLGPMGADGGRRRMEDVLALLNANSSTPINERK